MKPASAATPLDHERSGLIARVLERLEVAVEAIDTIELAPGGNSRETWIISLNGAACSRLVFRCDPDHWIRPQEMRREIDGLKLAALAGVPAPKLLLSSDDLDIGRPFVVTEFVAGTSIARRIIRDPEFAAARQDFARQCAEILAKLHSAGAHATSWPHENPLLELERYWLDAAYPSPVLAGALSWLKKHRPAPSTLCPVHRDFRLGNFIVRPDGIAAVLDWETCQLSDPYEDLAWLCSPAWRYGSSRPVGGLGDWPELLDTYAARSGSDIDKGRLLWWRIFAATRWGLASGARPRGGTAGDAMEGAGIARQLCRQEHYVLQELEAVL